MRPVSKSVRLLALILLASLASACPFLGGNALQGDPQPSARWASRCAVPAPGCIYLENHGEAPVYIVRTGQKPGPGNLVPARAGSVPGRSHVIVDPARDTAADFTAVSGDEALARTTCTLAVEAWQRKNPVLAWREGALRCEGGR